MYLPSEQAVFDRLRSKRSGKLRLRYIICTFITRRIHDAWKAHRVGLSVSGILNKLVLAVSDQKFQNITPSPQRLSFFVL